MCSAEKPLKLRPHHGMCLAFFQGKGYSGAFAEHMAEVKKAVCSGKPVMLWTGGDEICGSCPNLCQGSCSADSKVRHYDEEVLRCCGFSEGQVMNGTEFLEKVKEAVLDAGRRRQICGDCEWDGLCGK